jgi:AcrR family transcriptional regulator
MNTREKIFQSALSLIHRKGYHASSMRDIAKEVGLEVSSLYNHLSSKESLLIDTCFSMAEKFITAMDEVNDIYFNAQERLQVAIKNHVEILTDNLNASFVFLHEWKNLSDDRKQDFIRLRHQYEDGFKQIIAHGIDEGSFKQTDVKFATLTILSSLNWIIEWYNPKGQMNPKEIAQKLSDFILSGLNKEQIYH